MFNIMLDPGHGGTDPGAMAAGINEKDINLLVATKVYKLVNSWIPGCAIINHFIDWTLSLKDRVVNANNVGVDLFVSVHCNASINTTAEGVETFCYRYGGKGETAARVIHGELVAAGLEPDRGVKEGNFYVLKYTDMPAVLVELGFITNVQDRAALLDPHIQDLITSALAMGIIKVGKSWGRI